MNQELLSLVKRLSDPVCAESNVITWGSPVPSFGDLSFAKIATVGLNPSNREFVDGSGKELSGTNRRFHTLNSLGLRQWDDIKQSHLTTIAESCQEYFNRNPYDGWFKKLDNLISGTSMSYYFPSSQACHLDLIPYATSTKWTDLSSEQKNTLLKISRDSLARLLNNSSIRLLVLNGNSVVENFQKLSNLKFEKIHMPSWNLNRKATSGVEGYAYKGVIESLAGIKLKNKIYVLGYNHNIQSSFGVTLKVQFSIRNWISESAKEIFNETN
jgi:hypothetical protein